MRGDGGIHTDVFHGPGAAGIRGGSGFFGGIGKRFGEGEGRRFQRGFDGWGCGGWDGWGGRSGA